MRGGDRFVRCPLCTCLLTTIRLGLVGLLGSIMLSPNSRMLDVLLELSTLCGDFSLLFLGPTIKIHIAHFPYCIYAQMICRPYEPAHNRKKTKD